jgi:5-methylcytosine-specific restriction endonuclease McrBC GTP-binding regulatory subunit McrB
LIEKFLRAENFDEAFELRPVVPKLSPLAPRLELTERVQIINSS